MSIKKQLPVNILRDKIYEEEVIFTNINYQSSGSLFSNCQFKQDVIFDSLDLGCGLNFENCIFNGNLIIKNCTSNMDINKQIQGERRCTLTFNSCKIIKNLFVTGSSDGKTVSPIILQRGISIDGETEIGNIHFEMLFVQHNGISIQNSSIKGNFEFNESKIPEIGLSFTKSTIKGHTRISSVNASSYSFISTTFEKNVYLRNASVSDAIIFNFGSYLDDFNIIAIKSKGLYIHDADFKRHLKVQYFDQAQVEVAGGADEIYVKNSKFAESLNIGGKDVTQISELDKITIASTKELKGDIFFERLSVKSEILLEGTNYDGNIKFQQVSTKNIRIENFTNFATVSFQDFNSNTPEDSSLVVSRSNLGNTSFLNCNLNSFKRIEMIDSILNKITVSNINWFDSQKVNKHLNPKDVIYWARRNEVFRQLKYCTEENKDRPKALEFKSYEMDSYLEQLKLSKDKTGDKIILYLNRCSNKHGLSWLRGFGFTIFCWLLSYSFFVMFRDGFAFPWSDNYTFLFFDSFFWQEAIRFLWIPNGLDGLTGINGIFKASHWSALILGTAFYLVGKILVAYGIFQTISAFRKYGKSSSQSS